jgi:Type II secretion system (T2SS), protein F
MAVAGTTPALGQHALSPVLVLVAAAIMAAAVLVWPPRPRVGRRLQRLAPAWQGDRPGARQPPDTAVVVLSTAVVMELVAAGLDAGLAAPSALEAAVLAADAGTRDQLGPVVNLWRLGASVERAWSDVDARWAPLGRCLVVSHRTGAAAAAVLRATAHDLRSTRRRRARVAANRLGVRLVVPLGLTTLPAFLLWAVAPVALGLAREALTGG